MHPDRWVHSIHFIELIMLILLLMGISAISARVKTEIFPCASNDTEMWPTYYRERMHFALCCKLDDELCNHTNYNDSLTLSLKCDSNCPGTVAGRVMSRLDPCIVKYEVVSASSVDDGIYICKLNDRVLKMQDKHMIKKPELPVITSFVCTQDKTITVTFSRNFQANIVDFYEVNMIEPKRNVSLCKSNQTFSFCRQNEQNCTCVYDEKSLNFKDQAPDNVNVTIVIQVFRTFVSVESRRNFTLMAHIQPGPLKRISVQNIGPHDGYLQFCLHHLTARLVSYMSIVKRPLQYHIIVFTTQGIPEFLNVSIPSTVGFKCLRVHLANLTAYTNYTVIVSASGGGGEGIRSRIAFTTNQTVPVRPPVLDGFTFFRINSINVSDIMMSALVIMWQPLSHDVKGGESLSYNLEIASEGGFKMTHSTQNSYAIILHKDLPPDALTVKIWALNVNGRSENYTLLQIPPNSELPDVIVEFSGDNASVYVNITDLKRDVQLAISFCSNYTDTKLNGLDICLEYPSRVFFILTASDVQVPQFVNNNEISPRFEINMKTSYTYTQMTEYRMIEYADLQSLSHLSSYEKMANATVIKYPASNIQAVEDYDFYNDDFNPMFDDMYYDNSAEEDDYDDGSRRMKRDTESEFLMKFMSDSRDLLFYQNYASGSRVKRNSGSTQKMSRVFISLMGEDGLWPTGMIPTSCYFDRAKNDGGTLTVSHSEVENDGSVYLYWKQECNVNGELHFMADYFLVYSSKTGECPEAGLTLLGKVMNRRFQPNVFKIPKDVRFACVKPCKNNTDCKYLTGITNKQIHHPTDFFSTFGIGIIMSVAMIVLGIGAGFYLYHKCKIRQLHFRDLTWPELNHLLFDSSFVHDPVLPVNPPTPHDVPEKTCLPDDSNSTTNSGDSGHGTEFPEISKDETKSSSDESITMTSSSSVSDHDSKPNTESSSEDINANSSGECSTSDTEKEETSNDDDEEEEQQRALTIYMSRKKRSESAASVNSTKSAAAENLNSESMDNNKDDSHRAFNIKDDSHCVTTPPKDQAFILRNSISSCHVIFRK